MTLEDVKIGEKYECQMVAKIAPIYIIDRLPTGVVAQNLDTKREIFVKSKDIPKRFKSHITNMSEWRLHHGD